MSIDKSLRGGSRLARTRNVLTRDERIVKMKEAETWKDETSPFGLPKLRVIKPTVGKKKKKVADDDKDKEKDKKKGKK